MRDTPRMDIFAACCVPVFVKSLEELFTCSVGKQNCLTKKMHITVSSKRTKYFASMSELGRGL